VLLVKCKQAIEELHVELEDEKKIRNQNEETILRLEKETLEKEAKIRDLQYKEEKLTGKISKMNMTPR
jgi:septal ring factor EnvC (AmiA/AmiB activator)